MFATEIHSHQGLINAGNAMSGAQRGALALSANIRLGWKGLTVTNTLAYHDVELIAAVKIVIVLFL